MGLPGFPSHPRQPPKNQAGLMQLHTMAQVHQHEPKHMSKNQRPRVQLQEGESGRPVSLMSESFRVKLASLNDNVMQMPQWLPDPATMPDTLAHPSCRYRQGPLFVRELKAAEKVLRRMACWGLNGVV